MELATLMIRAAPEDVPDHRRCTALLADINDLRKGKILAGLGNFDSKTHLIKLNNIQAMELNAIRPLTLAALNAFQTLRPRELALAQSQLSQSQLSSSQSQSQPRNDASAFAQSRERQRAFRDGQVDTYSHIIYIPLPINPPKFTPTHSQDSILRLNLMLNFCSF